MDKKYIFFDIDGTIYLNGVVDDARDTILKLKQEGHKVFICTGRSISAIDKEILDIGFDGIIAACGLYISIDGKIIRDEVLPDYVLESVKEIMLKGNDFSVILEGKDNIYFDFSKQVYKDKKRYEHFMRVNAERIKDINKCIDEIKDIYKFVFRVLDGDIEEVNKKLGYYFYIMQHGRKTYEAVTKNYSKGKAITDLVSILNIDLKDTIAVGDGINDISMFEVAHTSILIGKNERAITFVDIVSDDLLDDGVSKAFRKLGMI